MEGLVKEGNEVMEEHFEWALVDTAYVQCASHSPCQYSDEMEDQLAYLFLGDRAGLTN